MGILFNGPNLRTYKIDLPLNGLTVWIGFHLAGFLMKQVCKIKLTAKCFKKLNTKTGYFNHLLQGLGKPIVLPENLTFEDYVAFNNKLENEEAHSLKLILWGIFFLFISCVYFFLKDCFFKTAKDRSQNIFKVYTQFYISVIKNLCKNVELWNRF